MCCCSIVGNPLICATGSEPDCYGTQLMPMSMNLNSSQSMEIRILTLLNVHFSSPFSITFSIPSTWVNLLVWPQFLFAPSAASPGRTRSHKLSLVFGLSVGCVSLVILVFGLFLWWRQRRNQQMFFDVKGLWS